MKSHALSPAMRETTRYLLLKWEDPDSISQTQWSSWLSASFIRLFGQIERGLSGFWALTDEVKDRPDLLLVRVRSKSVEKLRLAIVTLKDDAGLRRPCSVIAVTGTIESARSKFSRSGKSAKQQTLI